MRQDLCLAVGASTASGPAPCPTTMGDLYQRPCPLTVFVRQGRWYLIDFARGRPTNPARIPVVPSGRWYYSANSGVRAVDAIAIVDTRRHPIPSPAAQSRLDRFLL